MSTTDAAAVLTQEHRDIDADIEAFAHGLSQGNPEPATLARAFAALRRHIFLEEELLFPAIARAGMTMPVAVMMKEHGELWGLMDHIDADAEAGAKVEAMTSACAALLAQLDRHNGKEEPIVYPRGAIDLTSSELAALERFIAEGTTPIGWRCREAR